MKPKTFEVKLLFQNNPDKYSSNTDVNGKLINLNGSTLKISC